MDQVTFDHSNLDNIFSIKIRKYDVMHFARIKRYDVVHCNLLQLPKQNSLCQSKRQTITFAR